MDISLYENFADECFRDSLPPCSCKCPFYLDVRKLIDKLQRNNSSSAYRQYRDAVIFPGIVSHLCEAPCRDVCVMDNSGNGKEGPQAAGGIDLALLESEMVKKNLGMKPNKYRLPKKEKTAAIVGAGVAGLACTYRLASRGYEVTLFEKSDKIGGKINSFENADFFLDDIANECQFIDYNLKTESPVTDLDALSEYDAVFIATGKDGENYGLFLEEEDDCISLQTNIPNIFLGGEITGVGLVAAIAQGARAANAIEHFFKIGKLEGFSESNLPPEIENRFYDLAAKSSIINKSTTDAYGAKVQKNEPSDAKSSNADAKPSNTNVKSSNADAKKSNTGDSNSEMPYAEAHRCTKCECNLCKEVCPLIEKIKKYPKKMSNDIVATLNPIETLTKRVGSRMINTCTFCGACGQVCPADIDMSVSLASARTDLFNDGHLPAAYHNFWLRDLSFSQSESARLLWRPDENKPTDNVFFPGCQLGASLPSYVQDSYDAIQKIHENSTLFLSCCGMPAEWAGQTAQRDEVLADIKETWDSLGKPRFILACPACKRYFKRFLPEIETISLYLWLDEHFSDISQNTEESNNRKVSIFDPCTSRDDNESQLAVRRLAKKAGYEVVNNESGTEACCGFGGHMYAADPKLFSEFAHRAEASSEHELIAYCSNCRDIFAEDGKQCRHILDIVLRNNDDSLTITRKPPSLSQKRMNRTMIKNHYANTEITPSPDEQEFNDIKIIVSKDIQDKMNKLLILDEDIKQTLYTCKEENTIVYDDENDEYIAHSMIGPITYWAVYIMDGKDYIIRNVYSHRVQIKE